MRMIVPLRPTTKVAIEPNALHQGRDQIEGAIRDAYVIDAHDTRMIQTREETELLHEPPLFRPPIRAQHLDRDVTRAQTIPGGPDLAHPTRAEPLAKFVTASQRRRDPSWQ